MKFTHAEKIQHSQASLIPESLWNREDLFDYSLSEECILLMQSSDENLFSSLENTKHLLFSERRCAWLATALSHPHLNHDRLKQIGYMLDMPNDVLFELAALWGNLEFFKYLTEEYKENNNDQFYSFIEQDSYSPFWNAAYSGHLPIMKYLAGIVLERRQNMLVAADYLPFRGAIRNGHLEALEYLVACLAKRAPKQLRKMNAIYDYCPYREASTYGHLHIMEYLANQFPDELQDMICADNYGAFRGAAENGYLHVMEYLAGKFPDELQRMIAAEDFHVFQVAAEEGHLHVLEYLLKQAPSIYLEMIFARDHYPFRTAAQNGHLHIMKYLAEQVAKYDLDNPEGKFQEMIAAGKYYAFWSAAENGHLHIVEYLVERVAKQRLQDMLASYNYNAFRLAFREDYVDVVNHLLSYPSVFAYAEQHEEYASCVVSFRTNMIAQFRAQRTITEQASSNDSNISDAETRLLFYIMRNLIRYKELSSQGDISFLLTIPAVKALVHTAVTKGESNELLRLAAMKNNHGAARLLLAIPAVRQLAERHDYYRNEAPAGLNLRELVLSMNHESSMQSLSKNEQSNLYEVVKCYQPVIQSLGGVEYVLNDLKVDLKTRYEQEPATISVIEENGKTRLIKLPLVWEEFQTLGLNENEFNRALLAYYQNSIHTAFRLFLKPNRWLHPDANYVNRLERSANIQGLESLIALCYIAARDSKMPPIDDYTVETRLEYFIRALASMERAHNWDSTLERVDGKGNRIVEECDDLKGDRPSCWPGMKSRLYQSVQGHPLFKIVTRDIIQKEIEELVYNYFKASINITNGVLIHTAWEKHILGEDLDSNDWNILKSLNISEAKQWEIINSLAAKYGSRFSSQPALVRLAKESFVLKGEFDAHILNFGHINLEQLFKQKVETPAQATPSQIGLFAAQTSTELETTEIPNDRHQPSIG